MSSLIALCNSPSKQKKGYQCEHTKNVALLCSLVPKLSKNILFGEHWRKIYTLLAREKTPEHSVFLVV
jgi:hypothetical protein